MQGGLSIVWYTVSCSVVHCILQWGTLYSVVGYTVFCSGVHCSLQCGTLYSSYLLCQLNIFLILHQVARVRKYFYFILSHYKVVNRIWNLCPVPGSVWGTRLPPRCKSDLCDNWSRWKILGINYFLKLYEGGVSARFEIVTSS